MTPSPEPGPDSGLGFVSSVFLMHPLRTQQLAAPQRRVNEELGPVPANISNYGSHRVVVLSGSDD